MDGREDGFDVSKAPYRAGRRRSSLVKIDSTLLTYSPNSGPRQSLSLTRSKLANASSPGSCPISTLSSKGDA
jgi:hypothetical protein